MEKKIIFLFSLLFFVSLVSAVSPFQTGSGEVGMDIKAPATENIMVGQSVQVHTHAWNKSNGLPLDDSTTQCFLHLYNTTGAHIIEQEMPWEGDNEFDWRLDVLGGNFSSAGRYGFIIQCNATTIGGFASGGVDATPTGRASPSTGESFAYIGSLASMFLICILFFVISNGFKGDTSASGSSDIGGGSAIRFGFIGMSFIIGIIAVLYSVVSLNEIFWGFTAIVSSYTTFMTILLIVLIAIFIFILINLFVRALESFRIKRGIKD